ncbi:hypothetical protein [Streptomyces sp. ST2-7A]|nr:hypothetical protein [Streptomyces sp. ST2-7A]
MQQDSPFDGVFADQEVREVPALELLYTKKQGNDDTNTETDDI